MMRAECGLDKTPVVMAGGVWWLSEWEHWLDNKEIGPVAFQFGTRPLMTQESPISEAWKKRLLQLKKGDVFLNDRSVLSSELRHHDSLRVGEVSLLYLDPPAAPRAPASPALADAADTLRALERLRDSLKSR